MNVRLTPDLQAFIQSRVESGRNGSPNDVLLEALHRLQKEDAEAARLTTALEPGEARAMNEGVIPCSNKYLDRRIEETMNVPVSSEHEAFIQQRVRSGRNGDAPDVVGEALDLLTQTEREGDALRAALAVGLEQIERGETVPWTPDLLSRLFKEVLSEIANEFSVAARDDLRARHLQVGSQAMGAGGCG